MRTITIKNVPDDLYERLSKSAAENRRSINSEVIVCIERAVRSRKLGTTEDILSRAREVRKKTASHMTTDAELAGMKELGKR